MNIIKFCLVAVMLLFVTVPTVAMAADIQRGVITPSTVRDPHKLTIQSLIEAKLGNKGRVTCPKAVHPRIDMLSRSTYAYEVQRKGFNYVVTELWCASSIEKMDVLIGKRDGKNAKAPTYDVAAANLPRDTERAPKPDAMLLEVIHIDVTEIEPAVADKDLVPFVSEQEQIDQEIASAPKALAIVTDIRPVLELHDIDLADLPDMPEVLEAPVEQSSPLTTVTPDITTISAKVSAKTETYSQRLWKGILAAIGWCALMLLIMIIVMASMSRFCRNVKQEVDESRPILEPIPESISVEVTPAPIADTSKSVKAKIPKVKPKAKPKAKAKIKGAPKVEKKDPIKGFLGPILRAERSKERPKERFNILPPSDVPKTSRKKSA